MVVTAMKKRTGSPGNTGSPQAIDWLLGPDQPSVRYYTLMDILGRSPDDTDVRAARSKIPKMGWAHDLLAAQKPGGYWEAHEPRTVREWVNFLRFPLYRSSIWHGIVLSDLGLTKSDPRVHRFADRVFQYLLPLSSPLNIFTEEVCIVGNTAAMMSRFGYGDDRRVKKLFDWMIEDQRDDGGWNCMQGKPGTLDCWEALSAFASIPRTSRTPAMERAIERGAEFYLERELFREGPRYAPWFRFHYPTHYFYDILVGLDVLTRLGYGGDHRLEPALQILCKKQQSDGTWMIDMAHPDQVPQDKTRGTRPLMVEQPGKQSKWITLTALRILKRAEEAK